MHTMKVTLRFWAHLKDITRIDSLQVEMPQSSTVNDLLQEIYRRYPKINDWDKSLLIASGTEFAGRDQCLTDGEEISLMPPVQGG